MMPAYCWNMAGGWWRRSRNRTAAEDDSGGSVPEHDVSRSASVGATGGMAPGSSVTVSPWPSATSSPWQGGPNGATEQYPALGGQRQVEQPVGPAHDPLGSEGATGPGSEDPHQGDQPGRARLARSVAAEVGMYAGVGLVAAAGTLAGYAAWPGWSSAVRVTVLLTAGVGALAGAAWLRAIGPVPAADPRERAISALFAAGLLVLVGAGCVLAGGAAGATAAVLGVGLLGMMALTRAYPTAATETGVLVMALWLALAGSATLGVWLYPVIAMLGGLWAVLGWRWARGQRTAAVTGTVVGLSACVAAANGTWDWPARVAILALGVVALLRFRRGGRNFWLALGIVAMASLAATLAGAALSPLLALAAGGVAVFLVSWAALRSA